MVAQLLLEEIDHARSLLLGTIAKYADEHVGGYWADCITANVMYGS